MVLPETDQAAMAPGTDASRAIGHDDLVAIDLTGEGHEGWSAAEAEAGRAALGLPSQGFASPWGYWFCPAGAIAAVPEAFRVSVRDPSDLPGTTNRRIRSGVSGPPRVLEVDDVAPSGETIVIVVDGPSVEVFVSPAAWRQASEAILFAVAQHARFAAAEQRFMELQKRARRDYRHATSASIASLRQRQRLTRQATAVRHAVSDWVYFEGPGSDPWNNCSTETSAELATTLASELDVEGRAERLDEVVEDVENTYEVISDKLFHYRLFMWGLALEVIIILLLIALIFR